MRHFQPIAQSRKSGFTLVEIVVVLAIAALLSSIVFASFKSVNEGNKKTTCQTNMRQVYQALRLYGQDFNGEFPLFNPDKIIKGNNTSPYQKDLGSGIGLWALYAYPSSDKLDCDGRTNQLPALETPDNQTASLASYIKSPSVFHCPYDDFDRPVVTTAPTGCRVPTTTTVLDSSQLEYKGADGLSYFNPFYNSYQIADDQPASGTAVELATYSSFRKPGSSRQLLYYKSQAISSDINPQRRTPDTTVITWCRFHRKTDRDGNTVDRASNSDNVLFMDGTVRYLPTKQPIGTANCEGWTRIPEETVEGYNAANANMCGDLAP